MLKSTTDNNQLNTVRSDMLPLGNGMNKPSILPPIDKFFSCNQCFSTHDLNKAH